jgi:hypothetical protein
MSGFRCSHKQSTVSNSSTSSIHEESLKAMLASGKPHLAEFARLLLENACVRGDLTLGGRIRTRKTRSGEIKPTCTWKHLLRSIKGTYVLARYQSSATPILIKPARLISDQYVSHILGIVFANSTDEARVRFDARGFDLTES